MDNKIRINTSLVSKSKGLEILDQDVKIPDVPGPSGMAFIGKTALSATRFVSGVLHDVSLHVTLWVHHHTYVSVTYWITWRELPRASPGAEAEGRETSRGPRQPAPHFLPG